jgi:hypothetical protein
MNRVFTIDDLLFMILDKVNPVTLFRFACCNKDVYSRRYELFRESPNVRQEHFLRAIRTGVPDLARFLLAVGKVPPVRYQLLLLAIRQDTSECLQLLLAHYGASELTVKDTGKLLNQAWKWKEMACTPALVDLLLQRNGSTDYYDSLLNLACYNCDVVLVKHMLQTRPHIMRGLLGFIKTTSQIFPRCPLCPRCSHDAPFAHDEVLDVLKSAWYKLSERSIVHKNPYLSAMSRRYIKRRGITIDYIEIFMHLHESKNPLKVTRWPRKESMNSYQGHTYWPRDSVIHHLKTIINYRK